MRKGIADSMGAHTPLNEKSLSLLEMKGYKYVQVKGLTTDLHYDYVEPSMMILIPLKELPSDPGKKDIYAPIGSDILRQWITENDDRFEVMISARKS